MWPTQRKRLVQRPAIVVQPIFRRLLKLLVHVVLGCYVLLAVAFLGLRYWVLPNIGKWREPLQNVLSASLPVQIELGEIQAAWTGRNPEFSLRNAVLRDEKGRTLLAIPSLHAVVAWSSLFAGQPRFIVLRAEGVDLSLRRDSHDRISVVGYELESGANGQEQGDGGAGLLDWLSQQGSVQFRNARIVWLDEKRRAPPLEFREVALEFGRQGQQHAISLSAVPPAALGEAFMLQAEAGLALAPGQAFSLKELSGRLHVDVEAMQPRAWKPWLDVHTALQSGRVSWQAWQEVDGGRPGRHVSQVRVEGGNWQPGDGVRVQATSAQLHLDGEWQALDRLFSGAFPDVVQDDPGAANVPGSPASPAEGSSGAVNLSMQMQGLSVSLDELFATPLGFDTLVLDTTLGETAETGLQVNFQAAHVRNADMDLSFRGSWQQGSAGSAGLADLEGRFHRAELAAIVRYLPPLVDEDARQWMRLGLLEGRLLDAPVLLRGDLDHFPFGDDPERGDFRVGGRVESAVIDYAPAELAGAPGWPRLEALNGHAQLHRTDLTIQAESMRMRPGSQAIELRDVDARIPDIESDAVLTVKGSGRGPAAAFVELLQKSPLSRLLDGMFEDTKGEGEWEVPIALTIPLSHSENTQVEGEVVFSQARLQLAPRLPLLTGLTGRLAFSQVALHAKGLKAQVLGGPVGISGGIGKGQGGLVFDGRLTAEGLGRYLERPYRDLLEGGTAYRLTVSRNGNGALGLRLSAPLEGMAIHLPQPLNKPASARWPLAVSWSPGAARKSGGDAVLEITLADQLEARLVQALQGQHSNAFFKSGWIRLRDKVEMPADGLAVGIRSDEIDVDAWRELLGGGGEQDANPAAALLPGLRELRLQAEKASVLGTDLEKLTFTARSPEGGRWRVDVSSTETAGTLFWQERRGRIEGDVEAHFQRLAYGEMDAQDSGTDEGDTATQLADKLDFPAIRLRVDNLRLYGRDVGSLSVVGLNEVQAHRWRLKQLKLSSPHATLEGEGMWQLDGPQRGLKIQARANFENLGAYLARAGFNDVMEGGQGFAQGEIEWRDVPWHFDRARLNGRMTMELSRGRLLNVGSRSGRLLELLSLQSVKRLASFNWNPSGLLRQGFPFDTVKGDIQLDSGIMHSENYRVTGPVATIVIAGDVNLPKETLDLYAVVVPNLDVSGAAIAAGIAVNPIVGVGAFLTQWLLKDPMSRAMTVEYRVRGDFDAPEFETLESNSGGEKGTLPGHPVSESGRNQ